MALDRRNFLKSSLAGAAALGLGNTIKVSGSPKMQSADSMYPIKAELKLSFQEGIAPGNNLNEKFDFMEEHGVVGFEPHGNNINKRMNEYKEALKGRNIKEI